MNLLNIFYFSPNILYSALVREIERSEEKKKERRGKGRYFGKYSA